ncbi:hypothetical protein E5288_WYG022801 [Bos mutus]|uniref:Uncharacterized protein n=1 Tax=Bos mutus TaxID=72004 RepID=A0A6B0QXW9_9CETA|nr:hypothetical protein [Bos mutus]
MDCHWTVGWIFLKALEANMDGALCNAMPVNNVQRHLEEPEQRILALEQGPLGFEEPSISDSGVFSRIVFNLEEKAPKAELTMDLSASAHRIRYGLSIFMDPALQLTPLH